MLLLLVGLLTAVFVLDAAIRTFVLPRATPVILTYLVFRSVRVVFNLFSRPARTYEQRDRVMALYAPVALLAIPTVSLLLIIAGFTVAFYGLDHDGWRDAFTTSGSSLLTLGFERPPSTPGVMLAFLEATIGLGSARARHLLPPDDLRRVLPPRGRRHRPLRTRGHAAEAVGDARARAPRRVPARDGPRLGEPG